MTEIYLPVIKIRFLVENAGRSLGDGRNCGLDEALLGWICNHSLPPRRRNFCLVSTDLIVMRQLPTIFRTSVPFSLHSRVSDTSRSREDADRIGASAGAQDQHFTDFRHSPDCSRPRAEN